ncbi:Tellurium resistance [Streptomyces sp. NPDC060334]|uniref:TerD family protein n=1 Tax=unclassified Streptomyces TaxID=2593676 RepID=UPI0006AE149E|nr:MULTISPECIES: Tellurium resistance [unclassified Streptomyces]KOU58273.1 Tellurium resistance [Streptomyces sp. WM4235]MCX5075595.1 Tellurium resistance [Streptomyces sp. NBC_00424]MCX5152789.1 Tellurium resistance [Streptomyces sp. NBC_00291]WUD41303.1 Tellurium resistance [Streptomyces sp. NBC_00513]
MSFFEGFFDGIRGARAMRFDSGQASSNAIELTKRHPTVSLTKQQAVHGNLRVNLSWRMRTSDIGGRSGQSGRLFRHPFKLFKPDMVQAHTQGMVNVDLDIGCLYELADGTRGVVQPLGNLHGDINSPPFVKLSGDDRFGAPSGETIFVNLDHAEAIKRLLVFVYIYDQTPAFDRTHALVTLYPITGPRIEIPLEERHPQARSCAVVSLENVKGELIVRREVKFVYGFQAELDRLYGWGLQWGRGYKSTKA